MWWVRKPGFGQEAWEQRGELEGLFNDLGPSRICFQTKWPHVVLEILQQSAATGCSYYCLHPTWMLILSKGSGVEIVSWSFFFFSIFCSQNCKNIPTNHSLWSACFTWTRLWEGYQQLWFLSSELCTKLLLNSYVLLSGFPFKISYFYHPVALNMFCGIQMVLGSGSCDFISCNNFVTLLCILCCLFKFWILS